MTSGEISWVDWAAADDGLLAFVRDLGAAGVHHSRLPARAGVAGGDLGQLAGGGPARHPRVAAGSPAVAS